MSDELEALTSAAARKAAEEKADKLYADISTAEAFASGPIQTFGRRSDRQTVDSTVPRLIYAGEHAYTRKVYISNTRGTCQVQLYETAGDYYNGRPPFRERVIVDSWNGAVYSPDEGSRTIYTRIQVLDVPSTVYYHVEWYD